MTRRGLAAVPLITIALGLAPAVVETQSPRDVLYQVSTLSALSGGDYDGRVPFRVLKSHGDFGLGTFDRLDGEMVAVDGRFFRVQANGLVSDAPPDETTPFAAVTHFKSDDTLRLTGGASCATLMTLLEQRLPSREMLYAIRIGGSFSWLQTRSVPAQHPPYVPLAEALQEQVVFTLSDIDADMVGFWLPAVLQNVNAAGFHFHALARDWSSGGHVLDCQVDHATIEIDYIHESRILFGTSRDAVNP